MTIEKRRSYWKSGEWQSPLVAFLVTWIILWTWMFLVVRTLYPGNITPDPILRPYMGVTPEPNPVLSVWQRWDALHYQAIAERGYQAFETSLFTPPLYPILMRWAGQLLGGNTLLGGLLVSNLFCLLALLAFYHLAKDELESEHVTRRVLVYLLIFPTAFFLFAPYTEAVFFLGAVLSLHGLRKGKWILSGLGGALAAFSRLTGVMLFFPALWAAWDAWRRDRRLYVFVSPLLILLGGFVFPLYAWLGLGMSPLAPYEMQTIRFHGGFTIPGWGLVMAVRQILAGEFPLTNAIDLFFTLLFIGGTILVWKRLPRVYAIYCLTFMGLYLIRIADIYPLLSNARYVLALFPVFMALPSVDQRPWIRRAIMYISLAGSLFLSAQYAIWGWVG